MNDRTLNELLAALDELSPKLRDLRMLLDGLDRAAPSEATLGQAGLTWARVLLPLLHGASEASGQLRQLLLAMSSGEPVGEGTAGQGAPPLEGGASAALREALGYDEPPGGGEEPGPPRGDPGGGGGAAVGAGVRVPPPNRTPGTARTFEEADAPPRNP